MRRAVARVSVYSAGEQPDTDWTLHAEGTLAWGRSKPAAELSVWPPAGAVAVDVAGAYQRLAERGYEYGPAFQGLQAIWRRGTEVFAEVAVPVDAGMALGGFGIHPVLLDAALHAMGLAGEHAQTELPFSWQGVCLHAAGASRARVRIAPAGAGAVSLELADAAGLPVLSVRQLVFRPVSVSQLSAAAAPLRGGLEVVWAPVVLADTGIRGTGDGVVVWESESGAQGPVGSVYAAAHAVLGVLQSWLAGDASGVLVVLTRGAVALAGEDARGFGGCGGVGNRAFGAGRTPRPGCAGRFGRHGGRSRGSRLR